MRLLRSTLVFLATFTATLSFALPAIDLLDTAYDESEPLPYERTLPFSPDLVEESAVTVQVLPILRSGLSFTPKTALIHLGKRELARHLISESLNILLHSFRC